MTFRIPAASWDDALITLRALPGRVLDERTETDDVTGTVVDLEARIRNLRTTELAVAAIMASAKDIDDVLAVQEKLTDVRGQIEELQSKAAHLREQAALSTLTLHLELTPPPVVDRQQASFDPGAEAEQATARLVAVLQALAKAGIWLAIVWLPFVLALAVAAGLGLFALRRLRGGDGSLGPLEPEQDGA